MKTWQMIKELMEHPEKKFYRTKHSMGDSEYVTVINNRIVWQGDSITHSNYPFHIFITLDDAEWEEVKQPVTWQEALEAWANDCTIELSIGGERFRLRKRDGALALSQEDILYGAWYILDEEEINE